MDPERIEVGEVKARLERGEPLVLIDSRSSSSWSNSSLKIKGTLRIPEEEVEERLKELPQGRPIVIYCT